MRRAQAPIRGCSSWESIIYRRPRQLDPLRLDRRKTMATHDIAIDGADGPASIACTLTAAGLATQSKRWQQLRGRAMIDRVETAHGLRISFRSEPGVEDELRELVAVEKE